MSTRVSIAYVAPEGALIHLYNDCFDEEPPPVYVELWQQGEHKSETMTIMLAQGDALTLAAELTKWAASVREHEKGR